MCVCVCVYTYYILTACFFVHSLNRSDANSTTPLIAQNGTVPFPWPELDSNEPIYGTFYHNISLSLFKKLLILFNTDSLDRHFTLPPPNKFLPRDLDILPSVGGNTVPVLVEGTPPGTFGVYMILRVCVCVCVCVVCVCVCGCGRGCVCGCGCGYVWMWAV